MCLTYVAGFAALFFGFDEADAHAPWYVPLACYAVAGALFLVSELVDRSKGK